MSQQTTSLQSQINYYKTSFKKRVDQDTQKVMKDATKNLADSDIVSDAPKVGETLPSFTLPNQNAEKLHLDDLLKDGPVIVTFYRGGWCPYCNMELKAYQQVLPEINAAGATLVAITPELPDMSLSTTEKNELDFQVLSDINANYARELGLVFTLPDELRPIYSDFKINLEKHNGIGQFDLPLAATFVVAQNGKIAGAFVDADYTSRQEPSEVVKILKSLNQD